MTRANRFNRYNVACMLVALTSSENEVVALQAKKLLAARDLETACYEAVDRGALGGFMEAVVGGDFFDAFARADGHNRVCLLNMVLDAHVNNGFREMLNKEGN